MDAARSTAKTHHSRARAGMQNMVTGAKNPTSTNRPHHSALASRKKPTQTHPYRRYPRKRLYRARYYHAELGRFVSRDPVGYVDGMNLYRAYFVPRGIDPNGRMTVEACEAAVIDSWFDQVDVVDALSAKNCPISVRCECCEKEHRLQGGYFDPTTKGIVICANNIRRSMVPAVLRHELTHAYDDCYHDLFRPDDNLGDGTHCRRLACAEIRAYSRDGGCDDNVGIFRKLHETREDCIKRKAKDSISGECRPINVDVMFDECFICPTCSQEPLPPTPPRL